MAKKAACPQCGAHNDVDARRCRICTNLLNASAPEVPHQPKGLPESVQRQIEAELGPRAEQSFIPGVDAPGYAPPPPPLPPPPVVGGYGPPPPPAGDPYASDAGVDPFIPGDEIVIDAPPRHLDAPPPPPPPVDDADEVFDPDALFRDMDRAATLPPPPPPPPPPGELRLPPPPAPGPDPLWALTGPVSDDASSEEIERVTNEAIREERIRRRPGFLDKVFRPDEDEQGQQQ